MVKKWFPQNTFFSWFFTGRAFIMVYYIIKLDLEFQLDLQNPLKQPKMWIFEKWKLIVFGQSYGIFWPKDDLKPCIIMYLGNIQNMSLVPVIFWNFFFQILQNGTFWAKLIREKRPGQFCYIVLYFCLFTSKIGVKLPAWAAIALIPEVILSKQLFDYIWLISININHFKNSTWLFGNDWIEKDVSLWLVKILLE